LIWEEGGGVSEMVLLFGWTWFFRFGFSIQRDHCSLLLSSLFFSFLFFSFLFLSRSPVVLPATLTLGSHDFAIVVADVVRRSVLLLLLDLVEKYHLWFERKTLMDDSMMRMGLIDMYMYVENTPARSIIGCVDHQYHFSVISHITASEKRG
jgi:hypothetical protein